MKNKMLFVVFLIFLVVISLFVLPWVKLAICSFFSSNPPEPKNKYGEFPFKLIYEKNNERITIQDTLVIEHAGIGDNEGLGKYNRWKIHYKNSNFNSDYSTNNNSLVLLDNYIEGIGSVKIVYKLGSCEYYMGLDEADPFYKQFKINPGDIIIDSPSETRTISNEELYNRFNIKIIEKSISEPISQQN